MNDTVRRALNEVDEIGFRISDEVWEVVSDFKFIIGELKDEISDRDDIIQELNDKIDELYYEMSGLNDEIEELKDAKL